MGKTRDILIAAWLATLGYCQLPPINDHFGVAARQQRLSTAEVKIEQGFACDSKKITMDQATSSKIAAKMEEQAVLEHMPA